MAIPVLVIGKPGSGKTFSIKNFLPDEVGVISVEKGRLPFKTDIKAVRPPKQYDVEAMASMAKDLGMSYDGKTTPQSYATIHRAKYAWIMSVIAKSKTPSIVIDDSQYLLVNEFFDRTGDKGFDKFTEMGANFRNLIHAINELEDENKIVYFLHHCETDAEGYLKAKTIGKLLDEKLSIEGCFDIVIYCQDHKFFTQANGQSTAKTPEGMFELEIPNDLKFVDNRIREYYGLKGE